MRDCAPLTLPSLNVDDNARYIAWINSALQRAQYEGYKKGICPFKLVLRVISYLSKMNYPTTSEKSSMLIADRDEDSSTSALASSSMLDLPPSYDTTQPQPAPQLQYDQQTQLSEDLPILVIDDCRIYSAYAPTRTLYQLSNPVADANRTIYGIEKFRYRVDDTGTESKLKHVEDHIYDISREVQLRALPTIHIKGFTSSKRTYKSVNIVDATKVGGGYKVEHDNADKDELLRTERPFKDLLNQGRGNTVEWKDASGQVIAIETKLQRDDNKNIVEPPRLAIKASINDKLYDLLVTSWCAVIWREAKHDLKEPFTWQKCKFDSTSTTRAKYD